MYHLYTLQVIEVFNMFIFAHAEPRKLSQNQIKTLTKKQLNLSTKRAAEENILILFHLQTSSYVLRLLAETVEILQSTSMLHTAQTCKFWAT